jgi:hypothetical protein
MVVSYGYSSNKTRSSGPGQKWLAQPEPSTRLNIGTEAQRHKGIKALRHKGTKAQSDSKTKKCKGFLSTHNVII